MAIAGRKEECLIADQFHCGGIFSCNSDSSKSIEAFGNSLARGRASLSPILPKLNILRMFQIEQPDCANLNALGPVNN